MWQLYPVLTGGFGQMQITPHQTPLDGQEHLQFLYHSISLGISVRKDSNLTNRILPLHPINSVRNVTN